jgi:hypothetical protein
MMMMMVIFVDVVLILEAMEEEEEVSEVSGKEGALVDLVGSGTPTLKVSLLLLWLFP